jgi:PAS domain S-box-containing protein
LIGFMFGFAVGTLAAWAAGVSEADLNIVKLLTCAVLIFTIGALLAFLRKLYGSHQTTRAFKNIERARLAAIFDGSNDAVIGKSLDGTITDWNLAAERMFGFSATEAVGRNAADLIVPTWLREEEEQALKTVGDGRVVAPFRTKRATSDGKLIDTLVSMSPIRSDPHTIVGVANIARDISEQLAAENKIRGLNASLARKVAERTSQLEASAILQTAILGQAGYAIISTDQNGTITLFNRAAERMLGYSAQDVVGKETLLLFHDKGELAERAAEIGHRIGESTPAGLSIFAFRLCFNDPDIDTWTYVSKHGERISVRLSISELRTESGQRIGYLSIATDLTDLLIYESELEAARQRAERAGAAKSEFLANMSHEIRTPLNGIIGYADLALSEKALPLTARRHVTRIFEAGETLRSIVDDILDFSKIEELGLGLVPSPFRLGSLADYCISIIQPKAAEKGLSLFANIDANTPDFLIGDHTRLRQVISNLLSNAVKFTHVGKVTLTIACLQESEDTALIRIDVTDTGIGISEEDQGKLFKRFSQADGTISRQFGGTGLGLAISQKIVHAMSGSLTCRSEAGKGSTFWFDVELSVAQDNQQEKGDVTPPAVNALRVLCVDDVEMNRDLCVSFLAAANHVVTTAPDGSIATEIAHTQKFDVILMDIQMPVMDGIEAARQIRSKDGINRLTPIVALTANVMPEQIRKYREAGIDDHLGKPIRRDVLLTKLGTWGERLANKAEISAEVSGTDVHDCDTFNEVVALVGTNKAKSFLAELRSVMSEVLAATGGQKMLLKNPQKLQESAHKGASIAGQLGFFELAERLHSLEAACLGEVSIGTSLTGIHRAVEQAVAKMDVLEVDMVRSVETMERV